MSSPVSFFPTPTYRNRCTAFREYCMAPISFCGRKWEWLLDGSQEKVLTLAIKILALPCLSALTGLSLIVATFGALTTEEEIDEWIKYPIPLECYTHLPFFETDEWIQVKLTEQLPDLNCQITVTSFQDFRSITLIKPSHTWLEQVVPSLIRAFRNQPPLSFEGLEASLLPNPPEDVLMQLKTLLNFYGTVTFEFGETQAYIRIRSC